MCASVHRAALYRELLQKQKMPMQNEQEKKRKEKEEKKNCDDLTHSLAWHSVFSTYMYDTNTNTHTQIQFDIFPTVDWLCVV